MKVHKFQVPILDATVLLIVADNYKAAYGTMRQFMGEEPDRDCTDCEAFCWYERSKFTLFFEQACVKREDVVAHEIFHLTHRILEFRDAHFDKDHHEVAAMLNGWLTKRVKAFLNK